MRTVLGPFNLVLAVLLCFASVLSGTAAESRTPSPSTHTNTPAADAKSKAKPKKEKKKKPLKYFRVHVESRRDLPERTVLAKLHSDETVQVPVEKLPALNESHLKRAALIEEPGGYLVQFQFDSVGTKLLEAHSAAANGRHFAVAVDIDGETRWIAILLIRRRLSEGVLSFSPAASREDMDRLVRDLNKEIDRKRKQWLD